MRSFVGAFPSPQLHFPLVSRAPQNRTHLAFGLPVIDAFERLQEAGVSNSLFQFLYEVVLPDWLWIGMGFDPGSAPNTDPLDLG